MTHEEAMLKGLSERAAVPLIGAVILATTFPPTLAGQETGLQLRSGMLVSTAWLEKHLNDPELVILQVGRDRTQFDAGHIPGSQFVLLDKLVEQHPDSLNELPSVADLKETFEALGVGDRSRIVLVDDSGGVLAARVYFTLDYLGHGEQAALLDGGLNIWTKESRILSKLQPAIARQEFQPRVNFDILVSTSQMEKLSLLVSEGANHYVLLDARPLAEHMGLVNSESVSQAGHIAGSTSLYWKKLIRSDSAPQLLAAEELDRQFRRAGARRSQTVVTYCRTGMQSSFTYFVAKYLGYHVAMYDGSVYEWVRTAGNTLIRSSEVGPAVTAHQ
jgi:thiosulfate/3-mercaptopyruvate sulfurtransferase